MAFFNGKFLWLGVDRVTEKKSELSQTDLIDIPRLHENWWLPRTWLNYFEGDLSTVGIHFLLSNYSYFLEYTCETKKNSTQGLQGPRCGMASHRSLGEEAAVIRYVGPSPCGIVTLLQPSAWISKKLASYTWKAFYSIVNKTLHHQL